MKRIQFTTILALGLLAVLAAPQSALAAPGDPPFMLADINPDAGDSTPSFLTGVGGKLYFQAYDSTHGYELWRYDPGTAAVDVDGDGYLGCDTGDNPCLLADIIPGAG